ncbi:MAG: RtcB family protein, partial [Candidatus Aenigmatarchaeota archaeon]
LGHQVCTDYLQILERRFHNEIKKLPDRELIYAPSGTQECEDYFQAMCASANYAWANRQLITHWTRESFIEVLKMKEKDIGLELIYDVAHNIAKIEVHDSKKFYVHRKGATRAFPPGSEDLPKDYKDIGQPVLIPGSMGTASYILIGAETAKDTFYSTAHGAGRVSSRVSMVKSIRGEDVARALEKKGIISKAASWKVLAEEAPEAYKDVDEVVKTTQEAGISKIVARLVPIGVVKG